MYGDHLNVVRGCMEMLIHVFSCLRIAREELSRELQETEPELERLHAVGAGAEKRALEVAGGAARRREFLWWEGCRRHGDDFGV